ncbi:ABC transporter permease [Alicyclobacillus contaminans]|uniref:ABC transporter permease n=1 Tax=Alicyclobacillus contaminans TaxID=392016 RepID=UPI0003F6EEA0|nr:ABC transporter permease [Alicyclobacillus contaminans]GMA50841.1 ABC transporter permease [Alicyclobacillus contaminans]
MIFAHLIANEVMKMLRKRRFQVVLLILFALMAVFSYAEKQAANTLARQLGTADWHVRLQHQITEATNRLRSPLLSAAEKAGLQATIQEGQYELAHDINPYAPGAPSFMKTFMDEGITLLVPLFVIVIASDMVSSELSGGTIKMLLTRGVSRAKVLASKLVALVLLVALLLSAIAVSSYLISGLFFGYQGWGLPVLMGFHTTASGTVDVGHVYTVPQWKYLCMTFGLGFFVCLCIACLSFMVSTLVQSTASSMGIMMAALIAGTLLTTLATSWTAAKYLPVVNLQLSGYLNGSPPPLAGMTFSFSLCVLLIWAALAIVVSFLVFTRRDIMG